MRTLIQRVREAQVESEGKIIGKIEKGLLVFVAFKQNDTESELDWMANKIIHLRVFPDSGGKLNLALRDVRGEILVVSQFTLYADTQKGNRPSFTASAPPEIAIPLYERFLQILKTIYMGKIETGKFGAKMQVSLTNEGPVTLMLERENV